MAINIEQNGIELARKFLQDHGKPSKQKRINSSELKHIIEKDTGQYLTNESCLRLAKELGYNIYVNKSFVMQNILNVGIVIS